MVSVSASLPAVEPRQFSEMCCAWASQTAAVEGRNVVGARQAKEAQAIAAANARAEVVAHVVVSRCWLLHVLQH